MEVFEARFKIVRSATYSTAQIPGTVIPTLTTLVAIVMMKGLAIPEFWKKEVLFGMHTVSSSF